jgi:hypothetical protein
LVRQEVDDFERVLDDATGHELLSGVAALAHEAAREAFDNGTRRLAEALLLVAARSVGQERDVVALAGNVILLQYGEQ